MILVGQYLSFTHQAETFEVAIQLGAILAVVVLYWSFFRKFLSLKHWVSRESLLVLIAITPVLILGLLFHHQIKTLLFGSSTVIAALAVGGALMIGVDRFQIRPVAMDLSQLTFKQALIIGLCQCASLWPGMSRSGATIVGGILAKLDYATAAQFSFIISVPVMVAAVGFDLLQSAAILTIHDVGLIVVGFLVSFLVAMVAVKWFLRLLGQLRLAPFGWYRLLLAVFLTLV